MHATVSWYEATPLGRILNRFSGDISKIDQSIASQFKDVVVFAFNLSVLRSSALSAPEIPRHKSSS
jgi:hypothetical protein